MAERLTKRILEHVYYTKGKYAETLPAECEIADVRAILRRLAELEDAEEQRNKKTPQKCSFSDGVTIKPDGVNELDPCIYINTEKYANVTVEISKCEKCGEVLIMWGKQENTEQLEVR